MGREKNSPKKQVSGETWNCYNYIPVVKKRKISRTKSVSSPRRYNIIIGNETNKDFHLGSLLMGKTNNVFPDNFSTCKVFIKDTEDCETVLILECDEVMILVHPIIDTGFFKELIEKKVFAFDFWIENGEVFINIYFESLPLKKFSTGVGSLIKDVLKLLLEIEYNTGDEGTRLAKRLQGSAEIVILYNQLSEQRACSVTSHEDIQHPYLKPTLRPYQVKAVDWMLYRERMNSTEDDILHPLYTPVILKSGRTIYYDRFSGYVSLEKPLISTTNRGGILADEMGLGKTIEVLACILLNGKNGPIGNGTYLETDGESVPVIEKQKRKEKIKSVDNDLSKTDRIPISWVEKDSYKSISRFALEMWYKNTLANISTVVPNLTDARQSGPLVQCVCGSTSEKGIVECELCGKFQHCSCLGYKKAHGRYLCPQCWMNEPLIETAGTLIVTPSALRTQWCKEICTHVRGNVKVLKYDGYSHKPIYPTQFEQYDIVVTTYSVLQNELRITENIQTMNFRRERKYSPPGSPLTRVKWWRLCLDEAQTVETPHSMVSEMAKKIHAHFRWAVTGTPISKNISDLFGLIDYLQLSPYNDINTWNHILSQPYMNGNSEPMVKFLSDILWRTAKKDVLDQINIPKQGFKEHMLEFSAVEKYFYSREHDLSSSDFLSRARRYDKSILVEKMDRSSIKKLLAPLLSLRQACTHPNTVRGRYLATKKHVTSMKDLLDALILKNTSDSEECLRLVISSLNGLGGLHLLLQNPQQSIEFYRNVLQLAARFYGEKCETKLTIDKLQLIHTYYNLADVMEKCPPSQPTLRDSSLRNDCSDLEKKYMNKFINEATSAYNNFSAISNTVEDLRNKYVLKQGQWFSDGLDWIYINHHFEELIEKIQVACDNSNINCVARTISERNMLHMIFSWFDDIVYLRSELFDSVGKLYDKQPEMSKIVVKGALVKKVMDCHLRPQKDSKLKVKCPFCVTNDKLKAYESKLFHMEQRKKAFEDMSLQGSWKSRLEELIFKALLSILKSKKIGDVFAKDGDLHIAIIDAFKKEFKEIRRFWTFLDRQICAQDELVICKLRFQLKESSDLEGGLPKLSREMMDLSYTLENKNENANLLSVHELDYQDSYLRNEVKLNMGKLDKLLGTQNYLETLRKQQYEGQSPDPCPICKNPLEQHWSILLCGHSYCLECIQILLEQTAGDHIQCSVCRNRQKYQEISYIKSGSSDADEDCLKIKGNYSTKVEAIVKLVCELKANNADVKVLLFSSWIAVLKGIKDALMNNCVMCELAQSTDLEVKIENFKDCEKKITVLLLPINLGSKGLNLIEATHVILTEPLLNPADELQAIGRVHRIGQTKPTVVHKLIVKNTIEESIYQATTSNTDNWDKNKLTLRHLINLFSSTDVTSDTVNLVDSNPDMDDSSEMASMSPNQNLESGVP